MGCWKGYVWKYEFHVITWILWSACWGFFIHTSANCLCSSGNCMTGFDTAFHFALKCQQPSQKAWCSILAIKHCFLLPGGNRYKGQIACIALKILFYLIALEVFLYISCSIFCVLCALAFCLFCFFEICLLSPSTQSTVM